MFRPPRDDIDRFNRLLALDRRGVLSEDEARHIGRVQWRTRWGLFNQAIDFMFMASARRKAARQGLQPSNLGMRYFDNQQRAEIDEILQRHETD